MPSLVEKVLCIEVLEKASRLQRFLRLDPAVLGPQEGSEVQDIFLAALDIVLDSLAPIASRLSDNQELGKWERAAVFRRLSDVFRSLDELHLELELMHGNWLRPETNAFIRSACEFIPLDRRPKNVSIVLSNRYTFEEDDLSYYLERIVRKTKRKTKLEPRLYEQTPTVFLPKIERDNPLNWANLVHECGHADSQGINKLLRDHEASGGNIDANKMAIRRKWAEEIYCDIFATRILGPAYLASFATFSLVMAGGGGAERPSETHPADIVRIWIMVDVLQKSNIKVDLNDSVLEYPDIASFYYNLLERRIESERKCAPPIDLFPQLELVLEDFVDAICERIDELMSLSQQLTPTDFARIGTLANNLFKRVPIASCQDQEAVQKAKIRCGATDLSITEFMDIKQVVQERRSLLWEIVNAGWLHKVKNTYKRGFEIFFMPSSTSFQEKFGKWGEELELNDRLLLKSIELAEIHSLLEES